MQFSQQIDVKNVHPIYSAWIRTPNLQNMSILPLPLDQGSRPKTFLYERFLIFPFITGEPGIQSRLPYFADLGVQSLWLSPIYKSPMKDFGYDISDFKDVDPVFGTLDDFKTLVSAAHDLG